MLDTYSERFHVFSQTWNHLESDEAQKEKHRAQEQVSIVWSIEHVAPDHEKHGFLGRDGDLYGGGRNSSARQVAITLW